MFRNITRTVWIISLVSLLNDVSSEMLYPVIPLYLQQIGYGSVLIGLLEGVAECLAGLSKIYAGSLSDKIGRRLPFVHLGYSLSALSRPLIGLVQHSAVILTGRSMDRIGKGIRGGARDALLAEASTPETRAEVFGFHRSMDTAGAVLGPLLALWWLHEHPEQYQALFLITLIPGVLTMAATFLLKENRQAFATTGKPFSLRTHFGYWKESPVTYRRLLLPLLLFGLAGSSDMFLLLRAKEAGCSEQQVLMFYLLFNMSFALLAFPVGKLADRIGRMPVLLSGMAVYALTYAVFAFSHALPVLLGGFILYGLYYAGVQGVAKVLLIERAGAGRKSSAAGLYDGLNSFTLLAANALAGWVWYAFGAEVMLWGSAVLSLLSLLVMWWWNRATKH